MAPSAPRHLVSTRRAPPSSPPRLVRVRNPQRLLPRTDAGAAARCGVRRRPAPAADPPGCVGGVRRWRPRFPLTGSECKFLCRDEKKSGSPALAPWAHIRVPPPHLHDSLLYWGGNDWLKTRALGRRLSPPVLVTATAAQYLALTRLEFHL
jgi:hypothetical protein